MVQSGQYCPAGHSGFTRHRQLHVEGLRLQPPAAFEDDRLACQRGVDLPAAEAEPPKDLGIELPLSFAQHHGLPQQHLLDAGVHAGQQWQQLVPDAIPQVPPIVVG